MRLICLYLLLAAVVSVLGQDAYTQGVLNGATFALAGTAAVGLGVLALKEHQKNRRYRNRYNPYGPQYGVYGYQQPGYQQGYQGYQQGYQPYYQTGGYQQPGYYNGYGYQRRRRDVSSQESLETEFEAILARDKDECGLRLVCELEARHNGGKQVGEYGRLIVELFGPNPRSVDENALGSAHAKYSHAAYVGSVSDVSTCQQNYKSCRFNSNQLLQLVRVARISRSQ